MKDKNATTDVASPRWHFKIPMHLHPIKQKWPVLLVFMCASPLKWKRTRRFSPDINHPVGLQLDNYSYLQDLIGSLSEVEPKVS